MPPLQKRILVRTLVWLAGVDCHHSVSLPNVMVCAGRGDGAGCGRALWRGFQPDAVAH
jgi:hypothetical protein